MIFSPLVFQTLLKLEERSEEGKDRYKEAG